MRTFVQDVPTTSTSTSCVTVLPASTSCVQNVLGTASCVPSEGSNGIRWPFPGPDWLVIRPIYTGPSGVELRSRVETFLRTLTSPSVTPYTFPLTGDLSGGFPIAVESLNLSGNAVTFSTSLGVGALPRNTNISAIYPNLVCAYQTDSILGPSEKPLVSLRRLRTLGFNKVDLIHSLFYANTNFNASEVSMELSFYTGGNPTVVEALDASTDWQFPGGTLIFQEILTTRRVKNVTTELARDVFASIELNLAQNYFAYKLFS